VKESPDRVPIDDALLAGFRYACRPDCGLCCYAEPRLGPSEASALLQILPSAPIVSDGRDEHLGSRPNGGACALLRENRCEGHAARPSVCREFPLTAHVGSRVQATVVLTCPGVDVGALREYRGPSDAARAEGFEGELAALRGRVDRSATRELLASQRRHRRIARVLAREGRWQADEEVRRTLAPRLPDLRAEEFPPEDPPRAEDGLERLPLVYDGRPGPLAFARALGGWELLELRPSGGIAKTLGVYPPPERPPRLTEDGRRTLAGYLRYWLERDQLFGAVHLAMLEGSGGTVAEWVDSELAAIAALTAARADVLARARAGTDGPLTDREIVAGIRALDLDLLDRPTWGGRL